MKTLPKSLNSIEHDGDTLSLCITRKTLSNSSLKNDSGRVSILSLKVLITRAPVKECNAFRIKQRRECAVVVFQFGVSHVAYMLY